MIPQIDHDEDSAVHTDIDVVFPNVLAMIDTCASVIACDPGHLQHIFWYPNGEVLNLPVTRSAPDRLRNTLMECTSKIITCEVLNDLNDY